MQYIFDFDHTLFSTEAFRAVEGPVKDRTPGVWDKFDASSFFYDDTLEFIKSLQPEQITILSAWDPGLGPEAYEFQEAKIDRSGIKPHVSKVVIMSGDKGPFIKDLYGGRPTVFVDDRIDHLRSALEHCPEVVVVQIIRPGLDLPSEPGIPVISSLKQIHEVLKI